MAQKWIQTWRNCGLRLKVNLNMQSCPQQKLRGRVDSVSRLGPVKELPDPKSVVWGPIWAHEAGPTSKGAFKRNGILV